MPPPALPASTETLLGHTISNLGASEFTTALVHWLTSQIDIDNTTMLAFFKDRPPEVFQSQAQNRRVHEKLDSHYVKGAYLLDPFHQLHLDQAPAGLYHLQNIAPDKFSRHEYFATYYQRTTLIDELAFIASPSPGVTVTVCLGRDATSGRKFSWRDIHNAQNIAPIAVALITQHWAPLQSGPTSTEISVSDRLRDNVAAQLSITLSPRQAEVAFLILKGHSSNSIGLTLGISAETVKVFRKQLYKKCQISSQAELFSMLLPLLG